MDMATMWGECKSWAVTACVLGGWYLVGTRDDAWELPLLLPLALDHGLDDARVVGPEVDEAVRHAGLPDGLEQGKGCRVHAGRGGRGEGPLAVFGIGGGL